MNLRYLTTLSITLLTLAACENGLLDPNPDNILTEDDMMKDPAYAEGLLLNAYTEMPASYDFSLDYASDDAVTNVSNSFIKTVVNGGWTAEMNQLSVWESSYRNIGYLNNFLSVVDEVTWDWKNEVRDSLYQRKLKGEAYALRAWNYFKLLQAHAGKNNNGELLGVPIIKEVVDVSDPATFQIPRSNFNNLVQFITTDCERAIDLLPTRWKNEGDVISDICIGERNVNRINGITAHLIKAKTLLYAASPAYSDGTYTYQMAAEAAAELMKLNNGLDGLRRTDVEFYNSQDIVDAMDSHNEVFWYSSRNISSSVLEEANYPPSFFGNGETNPTQDLVDVFPMRDGTPVTDAKKFSDDPYGNRDPRLKAYIVYHKNSLGARGRVYTNQGSQDAPESGDPNTSLTGYYLRKFLNTGVDLDPTSYNADMHYRVYARYTDALLIFAEAANQIGPDVSIRGYTARQVVNAIRTRARIPSTNYVDGLTDLTEVIRNERRIELCFEGERFWDIRRWKLLDQMKNSVNGVKVKGEPEFYSYSKVENRSYKDHQIYGPIPFYEILKFELRQNMGW